MQGGMQTPCETMPCFCISNSILLLPLLLPLLFRLHLLLHASPYASQAKPVQQGGKGAEKQMQNKNQNQKRWSYTLKRWVNADEANQNREPKPKGKTGTGKKASGKRQRCGIEDCPAFASPSGSGFCSWHEQQMTPVGELVADARKFKCHDAKCTKPADIRYGEFCKECAERRVKAAQSLDDDVDTLDWNVEPL
jgi:hypothetical protein